MKSDQTAQQSTLQTASEREFSNRQPSSAPTKPPTQLLPLKQTKKKKHLSPPKNSLNVDKTEESESTARVGIAEATTPNQTYYDNLPLATTPQRYGAISPTTAAPYLPPANIPRMHARTPGAADSSLTKEASQDQPLNKNQNPQPETDAKLINKVGKNINKMQKAQHISWIRKLANQKWISILDTSLAGVTLIFFTAAFYFIFHINPTLEMRLTPEYKARIQTQMSKESFGRCNHSSFIRTDDSLAPEIDAERCFTKHEYGRNIIEIYKSVTPNSYGDRCNIDRAELYPCYSKNATSDSMNIFWGLNNSVTFNHTFGCNGTQLGHEHNNWYSFQPPVRKYSFYDNGTYYPDLFNRTVASQIFLFQCPKCTLSHRIHYNDSDHPNLKVFYQINHSAYSIPKTNLQCTPKWGIKCDLNGINIIKSIERSFSHKTVPFKIIQDNKFCS